MKEQVVVAFLAGGCIVLDGEFGGEHDEVVVENLNKELQIMVPGTHEED